MAALGLRPVLDRVHPRHRYGSAEWLAVLALAVVTVALAVGARHEWRRAHRVIRTA
jgi:type IV secretory pathway VirB2 component (pilin)